MIRQIWIHRILHVLKHVDIAHLMFHLNLIMIFVCWETLVLADTQSSESLLVSYLKYKVWDRCSRVRHKTLLWCSLVYSLNKWKSVLHQEFFVMIGDRSYEQCNVSLSLSSHPISGWGMLKFGLINHVFPCDYTLHGVNMTCRYLFVHLYLW